MDTMANAVVEEKAQINVLETRLSASKETHPREITLSNTPTTPVWNTRSKPPVRSNGLGQKNAGRDLPLWLKRAKELILLHFTSTYSRRAVIKALYKDEFSREEDGATVSPDNIKPEKPWQPWPSSPG